VLQHGGGRFLAKNTGRVWGSLLEISTLLACAAPRRAPASGHGAEFTTWRTLENRLQYLSPRTIFQTQSAPGTPPPFDCRGPDGCFSSSWTSDWRARLLILRHWVPEESPTRTPQSTSLAEFLRATQPPASGEW